MNPFHESCKTRSKCTSKEQSTSTFEFHSTCLQLKIFKYFSVVFLENLRTITITNELAQLRHKLCKVTRNVPRSTKELPATEESAEAGKTAKRRGSHTHLARTRYHDLFFTVGRRDPVVPRVSSSGVIGNQLGDHV